MYIKNNANKIWNVNCPDIEKVKEIKDGLCMSDFLAKLIVSKGYETPEQAEKLLSASYDQLYDPFLMPDMDKAVERIKRAVNNNEKILIYGDYDVDGVTSVALLLLYLSSKSADVTYYIPERLNEGYGLNNDAIDRFKEQSVRLIITVDSGITASEEIKYAHECGIDVVVTDHHECREQLPEAVAIVNPHRQDSKYPFSELAGVGVVFKVVCALEGNENTGILCRKYADIVALGTVADVMPIIDENRIIVKIGLEILANTSNLGLSALIATTFSEKKSYKHKRLTTSSISYGLAPRINAAGRIGDVNKAVELLITKDEQLAQDIARYLCDINRERQLVENEIFEQAVKQIEEEIDLENDKIIVLTSDSWNLGVIGIVSSKITERYGLPSILISFDADMGKGSGRSIKGFNINETISQCKDCLVKYGGHELAAGLTISREHLEQFKKKINEYAKSTFDFDKVCTYINADFEINIKDITLENINEITRLEPYGLRNPEPVFFIRDVTIKEIFSIGEGKHLKLILQKDAHVMTAVYFSMQKEMFPYSEGMNVDVMFTMGCNEFRGNVTPQMLIKDIRPEKLVYEEKLEQEKLFLDILNGRSKCPSEHLPDLMKCRTIFTFLKNVIRLADNDLTFSVFNLLSRLKCEYNSAVSVCMFNVALEVFKEMGLIELEREADADTIKIGLIKTTKKVDLNDSEFLHKIKEG